MRLCHHPVRWQPASTYVAGRRFATYGLEGVWAQAATLEACREELQEVLEEWIILGLRMGHQIPSIDGVSLTVQEVA